MSRTALSLLGVLLCALCIEAQAVGPVPDADNERTRLANERSSIEGRFVGERAKCYQHFEVNRCIASARRVQNEALTDIARQERVLNATERKRKAAEQVRKIDERNSLDSQESAAAERARRAQEQADRGDRAVNKPATVQPQGAVRNVAEKSGKQKGNAEPGPAPAAKVGAGASARSADTESKLAAYQRKQKEAAEHQAELEKRRKQRDAPLAAPLPPLPSLATPSR